MRRRGRGPGIRLETRTPAPDAAARAVDALAARTPPRDTISTGFPSIDNALGGGLRRGDLTVLAGDVGSGKSALALAVALRAVDAGARVTFLSGEMDAARLAERVLAIEGRARLDDLRRGAADAETRARLAAAAERLVGRLPTLATIPADASERLGDGALPSAAAELLVLDPLQALAPGARAIDEEIAAAVRTLKRAAVARDMAVLATSHTPGLAAGRKDPRPQLDDLGALGAVKQCADVVLGLFRQEMYDSAPGTDGATELHILKNRNGACGYVDLYFYKHWMRFEDMLEPDR